MHLQPGQRITAPFLPAPAVVKTFAQRNGYALIDVVLEDEHHTFQSKRVFDAQLAQIEVLNGAALSYLGYITCMMLRYSQGGMQMSPFAKGTV